MAYHLKVYIGTLAEDVRQYGQTLIDVCTGFELDPVHTEVSGLVEADGVQRIREVLKKASVYIGLVGNHHGPVPAGWQRSILEIEYELAGKLGIDRLYFFADAVESASHVNGDEQERLDTLKLKISQITSVDTFSTVENLVQVLKARLPKWNREFSQREFERGRSLPGDPTTDAPPPLDISPRRDG